MSIDRSVLRNNLYDLFEPLIQEPISQEITFDASFVTGNLIDGQVNGADITQVPFDTDDATTLAALAAVLVAFPTISSAIVSGLTVTVTSLQGNPVVLTNFIVTGGASQPVATITTIGTRYPFIWRDQSGIQPEPPYVGAKIISGPNQTGNDDFNWDTDNSRFEKTGLRSITLSIQGYGAGSFELLSRIQNNIEMPEIQEKFTAQKYSTYDQPDILDISDIVETVFEERYQMDIFMYIPDSQVSGVTYIENATFDNQLSS